MSTRPYVLPAQGLATCDPTALGRYLVQCIFVIQSKVNRDQVIEFFYLVGMADEQGFFGDARYEIDKLVIDVVNNAQNEAIVKDAVSAMKDHLDSLPNDKQKDPRKKSSKIAAAWQKSKKLKEGTEAKKRGEEVLSATSSDSGSNTSAPRLPDFHLRVDVREEKNLKLAKYAINCYVPGRARHGQIGNLVRYAASSGMVYALNGDKLQHFNGRLSIARRAVLYSRKSPLEWSYIEGNTPISSVENAPSLQLVNTKSERFSLAAVHSDAFELPEPVLYGLRYPRKLIEYLRKQDFQYKFLREIFPQSQYCSNLSALEMALGREKFVLITPQASPTSSITSSLILQFPEPPTYRPSQLPTSPLQIGPGTDSGIMPQPHPTHYPNGIFARPESIESGEYGTANGGSRRSSVASSVSYVTAPLAHEWRASATEVPVATAVAGPGMEEDNLGPLPDSHFELEDPEPNSVDNYGAAGFIDLSSPDDNFGPIITNASALDSSPAQADSFTPYDPHGNTSQDGWALVQTPVAADAVPRRPGPPSKLSNPMSSLTQGVLAPPEITRPSLISPSSSSLPSQHSTTASEKKKKEGFLKKVGRYLGLR